jgi:hypothetical protein
LFAEDFQFDKEGYLNDLIYRRNHFQDRFDEAPSAAALR